MMVWGGINLSPIIKVAAAVTTPATPQQSLRALWYKEGKSPIPEGPWRSARKSEALLDPRKDPMDFEETRAHEKVQEKPCGMTTGEMAGDRWERCLGRAVLNQLFLPIAERTE
ncbi:hypothetical protein Ddc_13811 [Ditylenchus destructor]|nr:hypothetical protein Ddc_13811 [Ditylenchus destructor]